MSNIIYEDADYGGYDGYEYPGQTYPDDDDGYDVDEQYNQPDSLDDCPDGEDVGELADALELNRKLKEVGEVDPILILCSSVYKPFVFHSQHPQTTMLQERNQTTLF